MRIMIFFCPITAEFTTVAEQTAEMSTELVVPLEGASRSEFKHRNDKG